MNEFTFACPTCGQNLLVESRDSGREIACPHCQAALTIPPAPAAPQAAAATTPVVQKTSGLAIASLVCSLVVCLGCIPGIILGHLAKRRIGRNSALKGLGLANAGLVIGYLSLVINGGLLASCTYQAVTGAKQAFREVQQQVVSPLRTNAETPAVSTNDMAQPSAVNDPAPPATTTVAPSPAADTAPLPVPEPASTKESVARSTTAATESSAAAEGWTLDLLQVGYPNQPAAGSLRGVRFVGDTFRYRNGTLTITGSDGSAYGINLGLKRGEPLGGTAYAVLPTDTEPECKVSFTWTEDGSSTTRRLAKGYALKLQFGKASGNRIPGKIYLCLPDPQKSYLAGTFIVAARN